jgi:hypothetical protein
MRRSLECGSSATLNHFGTVMLYNPNNGGGLGVFVDFFQQCDSNVFDKLSVFGGGAGQPAA